MFVTAVFYYQTDILKVCNGFRQLADPQNSQVFEVRMCG